MSPVVCQIVRKQALYSVHTSLSLSFSSFHDDILPVTPNKYVITLLLLYHSQPRSQGSLLPVPSERERRVGERTWERGCTTVNILLIIKQFRFLGNCPPTPPLLKLLSKARSKCKFWFKGGVGGQKLNLIPTLFQEINTLFLRWLVPFNSNHT